MHMDNYLTRKILRSMNHDYSSNGYYFITICTYHSEHFLGDIINSKMTLNNYGRVVKKYLLKIPEYYTDIILDEYVLMPNHIHAILIIESDIEKVTKIDKAGRKYGILSKAIKSFKEACTKEIKRDQGDSYFSWQKSYYDKVIETDAELNNIRNYITQNPERWEYDKLNLDTIY